MIDLERNKDRKMKVVRAQLGTALDLFIRDRDVISCHALACGAGDVLHGMGEADPEVQTITRHILEANPQLSDRGLREIRNARWNALKHFASRNGQPRDDADLIDSLSDEQNEMLLFTGWGDYGGFGGALPVAAQVFQVWWYALNEAKMAPGIDRAWRNVFPDIDKANRHERKRRLRRAVERYRNNRQVTADPKTDTSPLVPHV